MIKSRNKNSSKKLSFLRNVSLLAIALTTVSGCASVGELGGPVRDTYEGIFGPIEEDESPTTGARKLTYGNELQKVDLITLLDPSNRRESVCQPMAAGSEMSTRQAERDTQREVQCAFAAFYTYTADCEGTDDLRACLNNAGNYTSSLRNATRDMSLIMRRNQVQDEIIAASENACRRFKISLNDQITKTNFSLGGLATTFAGLGAIFTDPSTARSLSGAAAIVSGVRAEYNQAYLDSLTVQVVTKGIDARRQEILDQINGKRFGPPFSGKGAQSEKINGKAVRYASRPYIPLSPFEKVDLKYEQQLENQKEAEEAKRAELQKLIREDQNKIEKINRDAAERARAVQAALSAERAKALADEEKAKSAEQERLGKIATLSVELGTLDAGICGALETIADKQAELDKARSFSLASAKYNQIENEIEALRKTQASLSKSRLKTAQALAELGFQPTNPPATKDAPVCSNPPTSKDKPKGQNDVSSGSASQSQTPIPTVQVKLTAEEDARIKALEDQISSRKSEIKDIDKQIMDIEKVIGDDLSRIDGIVGLVPLSLYSVELAVADALDFHAACTISTGLEKAVESVERQESPGFDTLRKGLDELISVQQRMDTLNEILDGTASSSPAEPETSSDDENEGDTNDG